MAEIYVIIHELCVDTQLKSMSPSLAQEVKKEIQRINDSGHKVIPHNGNQFTLPQGLPTPSDDLTIVLAGALIGKCLDVQHKVISDAGYKVRYHLPACLPYRDPRELEPLHFLMRQSTPQTLK